jgi:hypothetical protein
MRRHSLVTAVQIASFAGLVAVSAWGAMGDGSYRLPGFHYDLAKARPINGIDPRKVGNFWDEWHLVNVRYRKDVGEQRFVYANAIAWKAIMDGRAEYPPGSMFGKVAYHVFEDKAFTNSLQPDVVTRVQLMKKDPAAYKATDGWGYALYMPLSDRDEVKTSPHSIADDIKDQAVCHACHTLVKDRNFVFTVSPMVTQMMAAKLEKTGYDDLFKPRKVKDLSSYEQTLLKEIGDFDSIEYATIPLFAGSLVESQGPLGKMASTHDRPYFLVDQQRKYFIFAAPDDQNAQCAKPARLVESAVDMREEKSWIYLEYCDGSQTQIGATKVPAAVAAAEAGPLLAPAAQATEEMVEITTPQGVIRVPKSQLTPAPKR